MPNSTSLLPQIGQLFAILGPMLAGFIWLDSNHEQANAGQLAETRSNIYTEQLQVDSLSSVLDMYDAKEQLGVLTDAEAARRQVVLRQRKERMDTIAALKTKEMSLLPE